MASSPPPTRMSALRRRLIVPVLAFGGTLMALMQTVIVPLLPALPGHTGASPATVSWMLTGTLLSGAVLTPVLGRAGDMYGRRMILVGSLAVMTVGSVMCAVTSNIGVLIAARVLQGTAAAVVPLATSILRDELPPERVGSGVALMSSTVGIGAAAALPLASVVIEHADWHLLFWATSGFGLFGVVISWWVVPPSTVRTPGRFDVTGALLLAAGLAGLLLALSKGAEWGWTNPLVPACGFGGLLVLAGWVGHQLRVREPLVDVRLAGRRTVLLPHVAALATGFAFYANWLSTAQLVQAPEITGYGLGASAVVASLCLVPGGLTMVALSTVSARLSAARGARFTLVAGALVIAGAYLIRVFTSENLWTIAAGATLCSVGTGLVYSALPTLVIQAVPREQTAAATGLNVLMRTIGQALCSTVVTVVLTTVTLQAAGQTYASLDAYRIVFGLASVAAVLAALTASAIPRAEPGAATGAGPVVPRGERSAEGSAAGSAEGAGARRS